MSLLDNGSPGYSRDVLIDGAIVWLLEVEYAGAIWRWSSRPIDVSSDLGTLTYPGGLSALDVEDSLGIVSESGDERSISLSLLWPSPGVALLIQRGHDLAAALGQLSYLIEGQPWESRVVVIHGMLSQPEYEADNQPVSFTLIERPWDDIAQIIPPEYRIDATTWPTCPVAATNQRYPVPMFGAAASSRRGPGGAAVGLSPAYPLALNVGDGGVDKLIISAYPVAAATVQAGTIVDNVYDTASFSVASTTDALGREVYYIDTSASSATIRYASAWYVTDWNEGGILGNLEPGRPITTAGEMLYWLASRSSVRVDLPRFASIVGALSWPVEAYVDGDASPLQFIIDRLLPILPVSLVCGPNGIQPVLWRYDARAGDAVEAIVNNVNAARVGAVSYTAKPSDLIQRIVLDYGWDAGANDYTRQLIVEPIPSGPTPAGSSDPRKIHNAFLRAAANRYSDDDPRRYRTLGVQSDLIGSDVTAARYLAWKCRQVGYSPRLVEYDVGQDLGWLELGAVVLLTDSELYLSSIVALVVGRVITDTGLWRLRLQILDDLVTATAVDPSLSQDTPPSWSGTQ